MSTANPFGELPITDEEDPQLVSRALEGDIDALERLVLRHQSWLYNIAVRMVGDPIEAEDVAQEVLLKVLTKLSTFRGDSSFRTWIYRIACNHVLNMRRRGGEENLVSFSQFSEALEHSPDRDLPDRSAVPVDLPVIVEEAKLACLSAMLLGLDRRQRLAYTLVELLGASNATAAELMEVTADNFRQILHRARRQLYDFMNSSCGLVNTGNRCRCAKKTAGFIDAGYVDPYDRRFRGAENAPTLSGLHGEALEQLESKLDEMHRAQQLQARVMSPLDSGASLARFVKDPVVRQVLSLDE